MKITSGTIFFPCPPASLRIAIFLGLFSMYGQSKISGLCGDACQRKKALYSYKIKISPAIQVYIIFPPVPGLGDSINNCLRCNLYL